MSPHSARLFEQGQRNYKKLGIRYLKAVLSPTIPSTASSTFKQSCGRASPLDWSIFLGTTHKHTFIPLKTVVLNLFPIKSRMSQANVVFDFGKCFSRSQGSLERHEADPEALPRATKAPQRGIIWYACVSRVHGKFSFFLQSTCPPTQQKRFFRSMVCAAWHSQGGTVEISDVIEARLLLLFATSPQNVPQACEVAETGSLSTSRHFLVANTLRFEEVLRNHSELRIFEARRPMNLRTKINFQSTRPKALLHRFWFFAGKGRMFITTDVNQSRNLHFFSFSRFKYRWIIKIPSRTTRKVHSRLWPRGVNTLERQITRRYPVLELERSNHSALAERHTKNGSWRPPESTFLIAGNESWK